MNIRIKTKLLMVLMMTALTPLLFIGWIGYRSTSSIGTIAEQANRDIAALAVSDSSKALAAELKARLAALTSRHAHDVNEILVRVQADTLKLADFAEYLYRHGPSMGRYGSPSRYEPAPRTRMFGSQQPNDNSWLGVFGDSVDAMGRVSDDLLEEIYFTEYLDILFKSVAATNPYSVQVYINTKSQLSRGMPFVGGEFQWVDATQQFAGIPEVTDYDFYYLADEQHNPDRGPEWTELYWDPAGLGWMVSSIAPVYREDELKAVVGIDITLRQIIEKIINLRVEATGFAFLMSQRGQAIAFPDRAAEFIAFQGSFSGQFQRNESFDHVLTDVRDGAFQEIIQAMRAGEHGLTTYTNPDDELTYYFAYQPVPVTGWSVGVVVPQQEVIAPAIATQQKIEHSRDRTAAQLLERAQAAVRFFVLLLLGVVVALVPLALWFARGISRPILALTDGAQRLGGGELGYRIKVRSGDEIEHLALTFNQMASDLQAKLAEIEAANQELKQLDELKSRFISMASHELRTPLIAIQGYVDLIRDGRGGEISLPQRRMLDTVSRNATRLARIVTELLDVSRIEENKLVLERTAVSLQIVIEEIAEEQKPYLESRGHTLTLEVPGDLPPIDADRDRLAQVVINLLGNAIKYTPDNGRIRIWAQSEGNVVHFAVEDNGIGIKKEDMKKLFQRFSTLGDITKHRTGKQEFLASGTGLGLSIVQGIVQAHGGEIWVESEYRQGSTFHVRMPLASEASQLSSGAKQPVLSTSGEAEKDQDQVFKAIPFKQPRRASIHGEENQPLSILVIDDEPDAIAFTQELLADRYDIHSALTSATGLREAIRRKPHLVLLDAWIPGISGYDVCRTLKKNSNTNEIPVIIFTAATQKIDEERAREAGADGFVTKPFRREQIIELIESFRESA